MAKEKLEEMEKKLDSKEIAEENFVKEKKFSNLAKPSWIKMKPKEMEEIIVEMAKQGETPAKIGLILRDKYGIPKSKLFGKRIAEILKEKGVSYKTEKDVLETNIERLRGHIARNKFDYGASRSLTKKLWVVRNYEK